MLLFLVVSSLLLSAAAAPRAVAADEILRPLQRVLPVCSISGQRQRLEGVAPVANPLNC